MPGEYDLILAWLDAGDVEHLAQAGAEHVRIVFIDLLEAAEKSYPIINEDRLSSTARLLGLSGHANLDALTVHWLTCSRTAARLDIASICLQMFWRPHSGRRAVDPSLVQAVIDARRSTTLNDESDASSLYALAEAFQAGLPPSLSREVLNGLRDALARTHANPGLRPFLARVIGQADGKR